MSSRYSGERRINPRVGRATKSAVRPERDALGGFPNNRFPDEGMADHRRIKQVSGPDSTIRAWNSPASKRQMAQYGISKIRDRQILIAASEFGWIHERGSKDDIWAEIEPSEERTPQLVYGGFLLNPSQVTEALDTKSLADSACNKTSRLAWAFWLSTM